jgi:micrococcal nuclease
VQQGRSAGRRRSRIGSWLTSLAAVAVGAALAVGCADVGPTTAGDTTTTEPPAATSGQPSTTSTSTTTSSTVAPGIAGRTVVVASITDGDTFRTGSGERVRLIGVDTPEVDQDACFATEATAALTRLIPPGSEVVLVGDVEPTDRFGRTLAYVHRAADGLDVNLELARLGVAVQLTVPPNVARSEAIGRVVAEARDAGRGLWGGCATTTAAPVPATTTPAPAPPPPPQPVVPSAPPPAAPPSGACHPSYPTVCIPPAPPDLDCPQIPHRRFTVVGDDPHGFDGDHDGIGCES